MLKIVLIIALWPFVPHQTEAKPNSTEPYKMSVTLKKGEMMLYWKIKEDIITFEVHGNTIGWIGIGFSPKGGMKGADIYIGWVNNGTSYLTDRHGIANAFPPKDPEQNVDLILGYEEGGWTILKFSRQLAACGPKFDREIPVDTQRLIWSFGDRDPLGNDVTHEDYHGVINRGTKSIHFHTGGRPSLPTDEHFKTFDVTAGKIEIPTEDYFYYNCRIVEIPKFITKHHIVKFSPIIQEGNEQHIHHIIVFGCASLPDKSMVGKSASCFGPSLIHFNLCTLLFAGWAIGGPDFYFPKHSGQPIGGRPDSPKHFLIETHYENRERKSGVIDDSGLQFHYTENLRQHDAGILNFGKYVSPKNYLIPPRTKSFTSTSYCDAKCISSSMEESRQDKINIFAALLHTHVSGEGAKIRHFRGDIELPPIMKDDTYDANYQDIITLPKEIELLPTDSLQIECTYNTKNRKKMTVGGFGSMDEMCTAFIGYYPLINLTNCLSSTVEGEIYKYFNIEEYKTKVNKSGESPDEFVITSPTAYEGMTVMQLMNKNEWTEQKADAFSKALQKMNHMQICYNTDPAKIAITVIKPPKIKKEYSEKPQKCLKTSRNFEIETKNETIIGNTTADGPRCSATHASYQTSSLLLFYLNILSIYNLVL